MKKLLNVKNLIMSIFLLTLFIVLTFGCTSCNDSYNGLSPLPVTEPASNKSSDDKKEDDNLNDKNDNLNDKNEITVEDLNNDSETLQTFLNSWEKMDFLCINDNGNLDTKIDSPWNKSASSTLMPDNIRFDIKKSNGWEVAFNLMNQDGRPDMNYFGLYNKYTGVLRIFYYYNKEVASSANDFVFDIILGSDGNNSKAYYASLNYGIPMDVDAKNVNLLGAGNVSNTFHFLTTPYSGIGVHTMMQGWYAFDIDMSAYTGKSFYTDGSSIQIAFKANNKTTVSLGTDILGKINGDMDATIDRAKLAASSSGIGGAISSIADILGNTGNSSLRNIETVLCGGLLGGMTLNTGLSYLSSAMKIGLFAYNYFSGEEEEEEPLQDKLNGKIDLKCNLTADTSGYLESAVSTNVKQITLGKTAFNSESNIGKGVWNINTSPVIYVLSDRRIYEGTELKGRRWTLRSEYNDYDSMLEGKFLDNQEYAGKFYTAEKWKQYSYIVRDDKVTDELLIPEGQDFYSISDRIVKRIQLPYFYDPTSFDVCINKDVFPDAKNVKVFSYCGVLLDSENKNLENTGFRKVIGNDIPETRIDFSGAELGRNVDPYFPENNYNWARIPMLSEKLTWINIDYNNYKESIIKYDDLVYGWYNNYYGQKFSLDGASSPVNFILEPQLFYQKLSDVQYKDFLNFPDMYVVVIVQFESDGKIFSYSRTYLPKVQKVGYEEAKNIVAGITSRANSQPEKIYLNEYMTAINKKIEILGRQE